MEVFGLFIWVALVGLYFSAVLVAFSLFFSAWKNDGKLMKWGTGTVVAGMLAVGLYAAVNFVHAMVRSAVPASVFADVFGVEPTSAERQIYSHTRWFGDSGTIYLKFETDLESFRRLVPKSLPKIAASEEMTLYTSEASTSLPWWDLSLAAPVEVYFQRLTPGVKGFSL